MQQEYHDVYKLVFLGDSGVGKTNIISNFVSGAVGGPPKGPTLGIVYSSKTIPVDARHTVKAQIWDTAGQENYRSLTTSQLRKAQGAFVVFDLSNRRTFESADYWVRELREKALENVSVILVGNKSDKRREVAREEAQQWARQQRIAYAETSAADLRSLNEIFTHLCESIASGKRSEEQNLPTKSVPLMSGERQISQDPNGGKKGCC